MLLDAWLGPCPDPARSQFWTPIPSSQAQRWGAEGVVELTCSQYHPSQSSTLDMWSWVGSSTFTRRMQPCQESRPSGMIPFYRWENPNVKGQIILAKRRIPNQTLTFLCKSSGRSVLCNLFSTNDQMRKFSNYFIFIFLNIFFYLNYLFYLRCWLEQ